jgi:hypothetical protein
MQHSVASRRKRDVSDSQLTSEKDADVVERDVPVALDRVRTN